MNLRQALGRIGVPDTRTEASRLIDKSIQYFEDRRAFWQKNLE